MDYFQNCLVQFSGGRSEDSHLSDATYSYKENIQIYHQILCIGIKCPFFPSYLARNSKYVKSAWINENSFALNSSPPPQFRTFFWMFACAHRNDFRQFCFSIDVLQMENTFRVWHTIINFICPFDLEQHKYNISNFDMKNAF